jgi:hypothetical protein
VLEGAVVPNAASGSKQTINDTLTNIMFFFCSGDSTKRSRVEYIRASLTSTHNSAFSAVVNSFAALAVISTLLDMEVHTAACAWDCLHRSITNSTVFAK